MGDALEAFAHVLGQIADGVPRLLDGGVLAHESFLFLFQLVIEQRQRFLVGTDLAELEVDLDLAAVKLPCHFGPLGLDFLFGLGFQFLRPDRGFAPPDFEQLGGIPLRHAAGMAGDGPSQQETQASARNASHGERDQKWFALENQQGRFHYASQMQALPD